MARKSRELTEEQKVRLKAVGFQPGKSGNPKGRPTEDAALKAHIRQKLPELIDRLEHIAMNGTNEASSVKAIETMLSYILSKATTKHEVDVNVTTFGDFLVQVNQRHQMEQIAPQETVKVIEGHIEDVD